MELKASTAILLLSFAIGLPSFFVDTHGLPYVAKAAWFAVIVAGGVLATVLHFKGE
ncbi:hypothetical protein P5W99_36550 [Paraburkholderia sp. A3BS-1L]|uniref:hypothetical protein n=1 Tax=Paraburkholderia sp. A3BS-1L TaxID=3028375 RepID=UPI003DA8CEFB